MLMTKRFSAYLLIGGWLVAQNFGIGTTTPTAQLHTTGTVRFQNYASGPNGALLRTDNQGNLAITNFTGSANDVLLGNGTFGPPPGGAGLVNTCNTTNYVARVTGPNQLGCSQIYDDGNNIGIGTANPVRQLHTTGTVRFANYASGANGALLCTDANGDLQITNFTGNINDVLLGNGTFGPPPGGGGFINSCNTANFLPKITAANQQNCSQVFDNGTNVGIATTSPNEKLHIASGNVRVGEINPVNTGALPGFGRRLYFSGGPGTPNFDSDNTDFLWMARRNTQDNGSELYINIGDDYAEEDAMVLGIDNPCCLYRQFMRVESRGRLAIFPRGTPPRARARLDITANEPFGFAPGTGTSSDAPTLAIIEGINGNRFNDWPLGWEGGLSTMDICANNIHYSTLSLRSDRRYKNNIQSLSPKYEELRSRFMKLEPVSYFYNPGIGDDSHRLRFGFIANDVEPLFPNIVTNAGSDPEVRRGLEYDALIPLLVLMVQKQEERISQLEAENKQLREAISRLQNGSSNSPSVGLLAPAGAQK